MLMEIPLNNIDAIQSCRWSVIDIQDNLTPDYHCVHQSAIDTQKKEGYVATYCLGFVEMCPYYEPLKCH